MPARIVEVRDAVVEKVRAWWTPSGSDEVRGVYRTDIDSETLTGRKVYVFPVAYTGVPATRAEDQDDYTVAVLVVERYADAGDPPEAWLDARVAWVESLLRLLSDPRDETLLPASESGGLWPETAEVDPVVDWDELAEKKLFWSVVSVTYREHAVPA